MKWEIIVEIVLAFAQLAVVVKFSIFFIRWLGSRSGCTGKISFRQFCTLYAIAPDNWKPDDMFVTYLLRDHTEYEDEFDIPRRFFYFSLPDAIRYVRWLRARETEKEKAEHNKKLAEVVELWQKDIDEYRRKTGV